MKKSKRVIDGGENEDHISISAPSLLDALADTTVTTFGSVMRLINVKCYVVVEITNLIKRNDMTIQEIKELNQIRPYCQETQEEENWYRIGLIDGLDAVSEIWHDQKERPAYDKYILVLSVGNGLNNGLATYYLDNWHGIKAWCYLDDILETIPDNLMYKDVRKNL